MATNHTAEYVINEMPMAHAIQWQAMLVADRGIQITYAGNKNKRAENLEMEQILNG